MQAEGAECECSSEQRVECEPATTLHQDHAPDPAHEQLSVHVRDEDAREAGPYDRDDDMLINDVLVRNVM